MGQMWILASELQFFFVFFLFSEAQQPAHLVIKEAFAWTVGLDPLPVEHELRDAALAGARDHFLRRAGRVLDINFGVGNVVLGQKPFCFVAVRTLLGGIDE
jgi:hypothetical protein